MPVNDDILNTGASMVNLSQLWFKVYKQTHTHTHTHTHIQTCTLYSVQFTRLQMCRCVCVRVCIVVQLRMFTDTAHTIINCVCGQCLLPVYRPRQQRPHILMSILRSSTFNKCIAVSLTSGNGYHSAIMVISRESTRSFGRLLLLQNLYI